MMHVNNLDGGRPRDRFNGACRLLLALWLFASWAAPAMAWSPDLEREQRMAAEIVDAILDGEALELHTRDGRAFLGILTYTGVSPARGTVVILHGRGLHPDWTNVVHPLRVGLPAHGWNTLSIQLPVLHKEASYFDYLDLFPAAARRIEAAVTHARAEDGGRVVILAHSCGSHMAQHWMLDRGPAVSGQIDGYIGIGMGATDYGQAMREPFALGLLSVPVLDLYGELDYPAVHRLAPQRLAAMQVGGHPMNAQREVADADHYFVDRGDALLQAVTAWLAEL